MRLTFPFIAIGWLFVVVSAQAAGANALLVRWTPQSELPDRDSLQIGGHTYLQETIIDRGDLVLTRVRTDKPDVSLVVSLRDFRMHYDVIYAEPDYVVTAALTTNDPGLSQQWHHELLQSPQAWDLATDCSDVIIAVVDTGIDLDHGDLRTNLWTNQLEIPGNRVDDDGNGVVDDVHGYNAISNGGNPDDDNGHGSHVAGVIAAQADNGEGVSGICWSAQLMAIKFLDRFGGGSVSNAARGIQYALDNRPPGRPMIINNSWVISTFSQALKDVLALAESQNVLVTVAAGNTGADNDRVEVYPAFFRHELDNMVSVANTNIDNELYLGSDGSSNFGVVSVDLAAPGTDIYSTYKNNGYFTLTGSSMATPMVSAAAALILQQRQNIDYTELKALILDNVSLQESLRGRLIVPGILNLGLLNQNAFVKPHIIYRSQGGSGRLLRGGEVASLLGFGLDDINSVFLDGEPLEFSRIDSTQLEVVFPIHARDGVISTNVTNDLFVRFELSPPDAINFDAVNAGAGILSWNYPGNAGFVEIERASQSSEYVPLATVEAPLSVFQDTGIDPDDVCYRLRSGFEYISPQSGFIEVRHSDYSLPTTLDRSDRHLNWSTTALGSASVGQSFTEQLLARSLGASFTIASVDDLPAGLQITETGFISGQLDVPGRYEFDMILIAENSCPEQKTFSLQVLADRDVRTLDSEFGGEYRLDAGNARLTRLQARGLQTWEPDPARERYEVVELQVEWDDISQANEGSLLTVLGSQLGAQEGFSVLALDRFDEWVLLGAQQGLHSFNGGFTLPVQGNQIEIDLDGNLMSARITLLIENRNESAAESAASTDNRCFIASAIYRDEPGHPNLDKLRTFRDAVLLPNEWGRNLVAAYYRNSPAVAERLQDTPVLAMLLEISLTAIVIFLDHGLAMIVSLFGGITVLSFWRRHRVRQRNKSVML